MPPPVRNPSGIDLPQTRGSDITTDIDLDHFTDVVMNNEDEIKSENDAPIPTVSTSFSHDAVVTGKVTGSKSFKSKSVSGGVGELAHSLSVEAGISLADGPKTPFGISRITLLILMVLYVYCVGPHWFQWTEWGKILRQNGIFDTCTGNEEQDALSGCRQAQTNAFSRIFEIMLACMFTFSFLAGMMLDIIGPRVCCIVGNLLLTTGWLVLACASPAGQLYYFGFALVGAGGDPAFFGTLSVANLFPNHGSIVIACLGAARSLSNFWPVLFNLIYSKSNQQSFRPISIFYMVMYIVTSVFVLWFIPKTPYKQVCKDSSIARDNTLANKLELAAIGAANAQNEFEADDSTDNQDTNTTDITSEKTSSKRVEVKDIEAGSNRNSQDLLEKHSIHSTDDEVLLTGWNKSKFVLKKQFAILGRHILLPLYFPVVLITIINIFRNSYYVTVADVHLEPAKTAFVVVNLLACIPGPIFGLFVNRWGPLSVMAGINTTCLISFLVLIIPLLWNSEILTKVMAYISVSFALPGIGFLLSQTYCYIAYVFHPDDLGKLAGFASFIAGLCGFASGPLTAYSGAKGSYLLGDSINVGLCIISYFLIAYLMWKLSKKNSGRVSKG